MRNRRQPKTNHASHSIGGVAPFQLGLLFFASGAVALVYEMLWFRQFAFFFGGAAPAAAAILTAYFAGLGIGSLVMGKLSTRWRRPLLVYAGLEIGVGLGALAVSPLLDMFSDVYGSVALGSDGDGGAAGSLLLLKGLMAFAAIAAPAVAMGGTLPVLAEWLDHEKEQPGRRVGWLYVVNTSGAALGALAFPFILLPLLGMRNTVLCCAGINFVIAAAAFWLGRKGAVAVPSSSSSSKRIKTEGQGLSAPMLLAFISGAGAFALQVLWNRAFAQVHENALSSFAVIVTMFIAAIALGAALARWLLKRTLNIPKTLGAFWLAGGIIVLLAPMVFLRATGGLEYFPMDEALGRLLVIGTVVIVLPIALLSSGMPLLFQDGIIESERSTADRAGTLLAANISGSIAGALLAGFVLPQTLGMWKSAMAAGLIYVVTAGCLLVKPWRWRAAVLCLAGLAGWLGWNADLPRTRIDAASGEELIALSEDTYGVVAVTERPGSRRLKLNNHYVLGGTASTGDERMQAHLPLLLHPEPQAAVFLGYGTGITAGGAIFHEGVEATGVELVPDVARLAERHFAEANLGFGTGPRTSVIINDARHYLRLSARKFDVIVGDLVVPWRPGESSLYTREHFATAKRSLSEGGLLCVWIPMFQLNETEFQIILNTFLSEFDEAMVWRGDFSPAEPALALIGFNGGGFDPETVTARLGQLRNDPANPHLAFTASAWMHLVGFIDADSLDHVERRINSEDRPWLELRDWTKDSGGAGDFFVGRELQRWETRVREASRGRVIEALTAEALNGWEASAAMVEFVISTSEGSGAAARAAQSRVGQLIGPDAYRAIFGEEL